MSAGTGVYLYDQMRKNGAMEPVNEWLEGAFKNLYLTFNDKGFIKSMTMYYDAELEYNFVLPEERRFGSSMSYGLCWYLLPMDPEFAFHIYMANIKEMKIRDLNTPLNPAIYLNARFMVLPYVLSIEFGDTIVTERLEPYVMAVAEGKEFDGTQFGYFFHLGENWPRGQTSSLLMCASIMAAGDWQRAFANANDKSRFTAPTVQGIEYPNVGVSRAFNDVESGNLLLNLYLGDGRKGIKTDFTVTNLPTKHPVTIKVNGAEHDDFTVYNDGTMKVRYVMDSDEMEFVISTGYKGDGVKDTFVPITLQSSNYEAKI